MSQAIPVKLAIDHKEKVLRIAIVGGDGKTISATLDCEQIADFVATLTQCQHALVLSATGQEVNMPIDPNIAFEPVAGHYVPDFFEVHRRHTVGIDNELGAVAIRLLSRRGRLTSIRMPPEAAQNLGAGLLKVAAEISNQRPSKQ
jgi:hypothetical protein